MPGKLPAVARWEYDNGSSRLSFSCQCGEAVNAFVTVDGGTVEARCPKCSTFVQFRASRVVAADGGKPGSGKGAF